MKPPSREIGFAEVLARRVICTACGMQSDAPAGKHLHQTADEWCDAPFREMTKEELATNKAMVERVKAAIARRAARLAR